MFLETKSDFIIWVCITNTMVHGIIITIQLKLEKVWIICRKTPLSTVLCSVYCTRDIYCILQRSYLEWGILFFVGRMLKFLTQQIICLLCCRTTQKTKTSCFRSYRVPYFHIRSSLRNMIEVHTAIWPNHII